MIATIVWIAGVIAAVWCVLDIFKKNSLNNDLAILTSSSVAVTSFTAILSLASLKKIPWACSAIYFS